MVNKLFFLQCCLVCLAARGQVAVTGGVTLSGPVILSSQTSFDFAVAWASDIHVGRPATFTTGEPESNFTEMVRHNPLAVICTGDIAESAGVTQTVYMASVAASHPGRNFKFLAGNHDACPEFGDGNPDDNEPCDETFANFNEYLNDGSTNRHWVFDIAEYRFIGFDSQLIRDGPNTGFGRVLAHEVEWVTNELAVAASANRPVLLFSHYPLLAAFGNQIHDSATLLSAMTNSGRVVAYLSGHRHLWANRVTNGSVLHVSGPGLSYSQTAADPPYSTAGGFIMIGATNGLLTFNLWSANHPTYTLRDTFVYPAP